MFILKFILAIIGALCTLNGNDNITINVLGLIILISLFYKDIVKSYNAL